MKTDDWPDETLAQRIAIVLEEEGWTQSELARQVGAKSAGAVGNWLNRNETMEYEFARELQTKRHWNARWLVERVGPRKVRIRSPEARKVLEALDELPDEDLLDLGRLLRLSS